MRAQQVHGIVIFTATLACTPLAHASSITQFSSRLSFDAASGPTTTQNFNGFSPQVNAFENAWFDFGDFSAFNGTNSAFGGDIVGAGAIDGSVEIFASLKVGGAELQFVFDRPINAIGFDANNFADQRYDDIIFNNAAGDVVAIHDPIDQIRFWGFVSDTPFTSITIRQTGWINGLGSDTDGIRFDNMTYSFATIPLPQPAAMSLVTGCVCFARHRRRGAC